MIENTSKKRRITRKLFGIVFLMFFTVVVLIVGTYAWFVGTGSVSTSAINLNVSSGEGLELSLDGSNWEDTTLTINKEAIEGSSGTNKAYTGHTNSWPDAGLYPVSTKGEVDSTTGRLKLYSETSLTATGGGFRLVSNLINNTSSEKAGYIAFDLFVKNGTGDDYITTYNQLDDEAIYLTRNSKAVVTSAGGSNPDYGLANSLRVAFVHIGRVKSNTTPASSITGIGCGSGVSNTKLCSDVTPTIWEPNNTSHNSNVISYFDSICKNRTSATVYTTTPCTSFSNNQDVDTYVVKQAITSATKTDVYDGHNTYTNSNLENIDTFTDTMKVVTGQARSPFMYLAPNSITKLRIYIYLEGQDVDNYDLISNGNTITINFGFTKDIFSTETAS